MSQGEKLGADLESAEVSEVAVAEAKVAKEKKVQTPEDRELLVAGVAKIKEIGVSEDLAKVLDLVADWNGEKESNTAVKAAVIEAFGGSEKLKDYIDGTFKTDAEGFLGLAKVMPVLNNIKAFYARRESTGVKKTKLTQAKIGDILYNVDSAFLATVQADSTLDRDAKRQALLSHPATVVAAIEEY